MDHKKLIKQRQQVDDTIIEYLLFLFVNMIITKNQNNLFAGNGLKTFSHIILHNKIIEMDCNTYDDCYDLLCEYIIQPVFLVVTEPYNWNGDCNHLNKPPY